MRSAVVAATYLKLPAMEQLKRIEQDITKLSDEQARKS